MLHHSFEKNLKYLDKSIYSALLREIKRGFEKETLRVDEKGMIAQTKHPECLGASLTHPFITTDFSEALLEFISPPSEDFLDPLHKLTELHQVIYRCLKHEYLWSGSMPCHLPPEHEIPVAVFGESNLGKLRNLYRRGLGLRYGKKMQTIAGIHYNFSFSEGFFKQYHQDKQSKLALKDFISEEYLGLIRNCLRFGFMLPLLFGASPACNREFVTDPNQFDFLQEIGQETIIGPFATSLRLSNLGYRNDASTVHQVSYNSFSEFLTTLHKAVHTQSPRFSKIPVIEDGEYKQLSDSIFQIENENYVMIRPKRVIEPDERTLTALKRDGIEYLEMRALDINPYSLLGVDLETTYTIDVFLLTCLLLDSPPISFEERIRIQNNMNAVTSKGRDPQLKIADANNTLVLIDTLLMPFLELMHQVSKYLDTAYSIKDFSLACHRAEKHLKNKALLPSARIIQDITTQHESYFNLIKYWSLKHKSVFQGLPFSPDQVQYYERLANESVLAKEKLEKAADTPFAEYLQKFLAP